MIQSTNNRIETINSTLNKFYRLRSKVFSRKYSELGISLLQASVLRALHDKDGCIQKELCDLIDVAPPVMVNLLSSLEEMKLVERKHNPENRRILNIHLTDSGWAVSREIHNIVASTEEEYLSLLSSSEKEQLFRLLTKSYQSWELHCSE